jgi:hypothetical protein
VSRLAIISGSAAFLAPEIGIAPWSGAPPVMRMRSMVLPSGGPGRLGMGLRAEIRLFGGSRLE